ncbi:MAG TPA: M17 family peptidase N-terminal domain-containing protein, partial [Planctomicrobium sp.]|nr:M17 family peptidase N-terminal domain-containing protein [Planctomicrobium sp.]
MFSSHPRYTNESLSELKIDWLVVGVPENAELSPELQQLDQSLHGALTQLRERGELKGKPGEVTLLPICPGIAAERLLLVG